MNEQEITMNEQVTESMENAVEAVKDFAPAVESKGISGKVVFATAVTIAVLAGGVYGAVKYIGKKKGKNPDIIDVPKHKIRPVKDESEDNESDKEETEK